MKVIKIEPSFYFNADIITTDCSHTHARPIGMYKVGDTMNCPFCNDITNIKK